MSALLLLSLALVDDSSKPVLKESIVVSGIRAEEKTPVTKTGIDKTKEGASTVADKSAGTAKKVGSKTKEGADAVIDATKAGAKKATKAVQKIIP